MIANALLSIALLAMFGCATVGDFGGTDIPVLSKLPVAEKASDGSSVSEALGKLADNPLLRAANQDADDTLAWIATQTMTPLQKFQASACPTAIKLATADLRVKVKTLQNLLDVKAADLTGIATQGPHLVLALTKLRYGAAGAPGSNPQALVAELKKDVAARVTAVLDSCRMIFPGHEIAAVLKLAGRAGLLGATGGAAAPFLGILP